MKKTIVLYPGLFVSHLVPMMELADVLLEEGYAVTAAVIDLTLDQDAALAAAVDRVAAARPSVAVRRLPRIQDPPAVADYGDASSGTSRSSGATTSASASSSAPRLPEASTLWSSTRLP